MLGERARSALAEGSGSRFRDIRWAPETGSTNADVMALVHDGAAEGVVVVADHQTAGRGRAGRRWIAPRDGSLLVSILLRPPAAVVDLATMAVAVAAARAIEDLVGVAPRLKWPNDLVWPGDGSAPDRKLGGILAEADWPAGVTADSGWREPGPDERVAVVVGIGINVWWPTWPELPDEVAGTAIAINHIAPRFDIDREDLLVALLRRLDEIYGPLVASRERHPLLDEWRSRSATLGRAVRIDLGQEDLIGTAVDVTPQGHLVVETSDGERREVAVGDVVHLRPG